MLQSDCAPGEGTYVFNDYIYASTVGVEEIAEAEDDAADKVLHCCGGLFMRMLVIWRDWGRGGL